MTLPGIFLVFLLQAPAQAPPAELRFNWPRDLTARVETEKTRERQTGATTSSTFRGSYRMRVVPHAEGLLIRYDEFKFDGAPPAELAAASQTLSAMMPNLIVDGAGAFLRVENIESLKGAVAALFEPLQKRGDMAAGLKEFVSQFLTDRFLTSLAAQEWQLLVSAWQDLPLTTEKFEVETEEPSPLWADVKVPMKVTGGLVERGPCTRGPAKVDCAVFELRSAVDQAAMEPLIKRLLDGLKDLQGVKYERMDVVTITRVRLETATMVPHDVMTTKTVEMTVTAPGEGRMAVKQIDRRASRFVY